MVDESAGAMRLLLKRQKQTQDNKQQRTLEQTPWRSRSKGEPLEGASAMSGPGIGPLDPVRVRGADTAGRSLAFEDSIREACETFRLDLC